MKLDYKKITDEILSRGFWLRLIIMSLSILLLAIDYNTFLLPNGLVIGGVSGIATIFHTYLNMNPATIIFILNLFFIVFSFIFLGPRDTGLTIIGSLLFPAFVYLTEPICATLAIHLEFDSVILIALIGGILLGISQGFIYKTGYSTGGIDIAILAINKYFKIPTGTATFFVNVLIIGSGILIFGLNKTLYSIILVAITSVIVDKILLGISDNKMFYIHTDKPDEVKEYINTIESGYTIIKATGEHAKEKNDLIMCVISTKDYYKFKHVITKIDPDAFFVISDCYEVYGGKRKRNFPFI